MDAIYYSAMLIGVAWLAVWSVLPEGPARTRWWWPFDMAEETDAPPPVPDQRRKAGLAARWRGARPKPARADMAAPPPAGTVATASRRNGTAGAKPTWRRRSGQ